jgi:hypothetical protein
MSPFKALSSPRMAMAIHEVKCSEFVFRDESYVEITIFRSLNESLSLSLTHSPES